MTSGKQSFDAGAFNEATQAARQSVADARARWELFRRTWFGPVSQASLGLARLESGDCVLDIATGTVEPALSVAPVVGPTAYVLATNIFECGGPARRAAPAFVFGR